LQKAPAGATLLHRLESECATVSRCPSAIDIDIDIDIDIVKVFILK